MLGQIDRLEFLAGDVRYPVEFRQPLVEKAIAGGDELLDRAVFPEDEIEEHFGFPLHVGAQPRIECLGGGAVCGGAEDALRADRHGFHVARLQPLAYEIFHHPLRTRVLEHAVHLRGEIRAEFVVEG